MVKVFVLQFAFLTKWSIQSVAKLAWAAGFLEGEGCFRFGNGANVNAGQVQRQPLQNLHTWFGGSLYKSKTPLGKPMWRWSLFGAHAVAFMFTIYPMLSVRRQKQLYTLCVNGKSNLVANVMLQ